MFGQDDRPDETADAAATTIQPTTDTDDTANITVSTDGDMTVDSGSTDDAATVADESNEATAPEEVTPTETEEAPTSHEAPDVTPPEASEETPAVSDDSTPAPVADDSLLEIKKEALSDLAPLVDHLDQTPEEHFKTMMMLIQATDDSSHIKAAYESAQKISDDDARAQALLDIVNEINYFTQAHKSDD